MSELSRRNLLTGLAAATLAPQLAEAKEPDKPEPFLYSLNTSTIRGQKVGIVEEINIAAKVGYGAIEPWINELDLYVKDGGNLRDLGKRIADAGLKVESAIGFPAWIVDDDTQRKQGLEEARRAMDIVRTIGGIRLAAPPVGATKQTDLSLPKAAERYRELLEVGAKIGVVPQVEVWGFSTSLSKLGEAAQVAIEAGHPDACILADVYHLHKGGSGFQGLPLLGAEAMHVFHMNDFPAQPARTDITDAHRVYPGDGVAPLGKLLRDLYALGFRGVLSLELFNPEYWKQDATVVARTGLEKMKDVVRKSFAKDK